MFLFIFNNVSCDYNSRSLENHLRFICKFFFFLLILLYIVYITENNKKCFLILYIQMLQGPYLKHLNLLHMASSHSNSLLTYLCHHHQYNCACIYYIHINRWMPKALGVSSPSMSRKAIMVAEIEKKIFFFNIQGLCRSTFPSKLTRIFTPRQKLVFGYKGYILPMALQFSLCKRSNLTLSCV